MEIELREAWQKTERDNLESFRLAELLDDIETEQHLVNVFKLEIQAKQEELVEKDRSLQKMAFFE